MMRMVGGFGRPAPIIEPNPAGAAPPVGPAATLMTRAAVTLAAISEDRADEP
jgi:hypothetical protein